MFNMFQTHVWYVSDSCLICPRLILICLRLPFVITQTHVWYVSDSCLICLRLVFNLSQSDVQYVSVSCLRLIKQQFWDVSNSKSKIYKTAGLRHINSKSETCQMQVWDVLKTVLRHSKQQIWNILNKEYDTYWTASLRHIEQQVWDILNSKSLIDMTSLLALWHVGHLFSYCLKVAKTFQIC